jgi:hypothetical protein
MPHSRSPSTQPPALALEAIQLPTFNVSHQLSGGVLTVHLRGNADSDVAEVFDRYLVRLHEEATAAHVMEVVFDFRELYFLTSSCIKCLVVAIKRVMTLDARAQYKIQLHTSPALRWQERSFEVLCQLAPILVSMTRD